ncbi:MAG: hypothetical protein COA89_16265 [Acidithiobacillus sp.]|jgi:hypothetical protein|nr:MAG: hypothetical protein COA89_16265 [Acidithiobacillus sp.]
MAKSKGKTRRIAGLPKDTERLTHSLLTSEDDPAYAQHTMTYSMREVVKTKRVSGGWAKPDDPIYKRGWTIAPVMSARRRKR